MTYTISPAALWYDNRENAAVQGAICSRDEGEKPAGYADAGGGWFIGRYRGMRESGGIET